MKVKLHEIKAHPDGLDVDVAYPGEWLSEVLGEELAEHTGEEELALSAHLQMNRDEVLVRGRGEGSLSLRCSRCLEPVSQALDFSFDLLFVPRAKEPKVPRGAEVRLEAQDLDVDFFDGEEIDLDLIAREQLLLALPSYPICQSDCRGLCGHCGANLNEALCGCSQSKPTDPRLAKLAQFMPASQGGDPSTRGD